MRLKWLLTVMLALALGGCASGGAINANDETVSLVYGYFDMEDAPSGVDWVFLQQYGTKAKEAEGYSIGAKDGLFFHIGIEPGSYQVDRFGGGGGFFSRLVEYDFGGKGRNRTAIRIRKPGVYFLGAYRYVNHAGKGFFAPDKFEMQPAKAPGEKELLQRVIKRMESDDELKPYTRQLHLAKRRLGEL